MGLTIDITYGGFTLLHQAEYQGDPLQRRFNRPMIAPFRLPVGQQTSRQLIVAVESTTAKSSWYTAGNLITFIEPLAGPPDGVPAAVVDRRRVPLNRYEYIRLDRIIPGYFLGFEPVPWLVSMKLKVWKFNGVSRDEVLEQLDGIEGQLDTIEEKIDLINGG